MQTKVVGAHKGNPTSESYPPLFIRRGGVEEGSQPHAAEFCTHQWDLLLSEVVLSHTKDAIRTMADVVLDIRVYSIAP